MGPTLATARPHIVKKTLSSIGRFLFEPSRHLTDVADRRRARLLAMFVLPHSLHLTVSALVIHFTEEGGMREMLPPILAGMLPFLLVAYALSRTRYARQSGWLYILVNLTTPCLVLYLAGPSGAVSPIRTVPFMIPAVLLASVIEPVAAPLIAGVAGLGALALISKRVGSPSWIAEMRQSGILVTIVVFLVVIFSIHRDKLEADRAAELQARNKELEALRKSLEDRVRERTAELSARNHEMRLVFDNMAEGLFTVDESGRMSSEHSAALTRWFGATEGNEPFFQYFGRHSALFGQMAELGWQQLVDGFLDVSMALAQMPETLVANGRTYHFSYQTIGAGEQARFLAFVADVTNQIEHDNLQQEKRETFALFEQMLADRSGFLQFMEEASGIVARVLAGSSSPTNETERFTLSKAPAWYSAWKAWADSAMSSRRASPRQARTRRPRTSLSWATGGSA